MIDDRFRPMFANRAQEPPRPVTDSYRFRGAVCKVAKAPEPKTANFRRTEEYVELFELLKSIPEGESLSMSFPNPVEAERQRNLIRVAASKRHVKITLQRDPAAREVLWIRLAAKEEVPA